MGSEIFAIRNFSLAYIWLDSAFVLILLGLLLWKKRNLTFLWSVFGGILYFIVDYGIFYKALGSRTIYLEGNLLGDLGTALVLLWMSLSYGITNFAWIWLCLSKDRDLKEWTVLIFSWWICCPMIAERFTSAAVQTVRSTGQYHSTMAAILFVSYLILIIWNMRQDKDRKVDILWLNAIGIAIQFGWEFALLIGGIRSNVETLTLEMKIRTLVVNSLLETNLGMPLMYLIFAFVTKRFREDGKKRD